MDRQANEVVRKRTKRQVCDAYRNKLLSRPDITHLESGFTDRLKRHFDLLPTRYALDINLDTLDVLNHMQLLEEARSDPSAVFFHVRIVEVLLHNHAQPSPDDPDASGMIDTEPEQVCLTDLAWLILVNELCTPWRCCLRLLCCGMPFTTYGMPCFERHNVV
jgi:hypothetical protein